MASEDETKRVHNWCFTWNNYPDDHEEILLKCEYVYMIWGYEVGEECGTPHLQGYIQFPKAMTLGMCKKISNKIRWINANGDVHHQKVYCSKGYQPKSEYKKLGVKGPNYGIGAEVKEFGTPKQQGKRVDLEATRNLINSGATMLEVANNDFGTFLRYNKGLMLYKTLVDKKKAIERGFKPRNIQVHWGVPGSGKSHDAFADIKARGETGNVFILTPGISGMWWTGYDGENNVIIDDFKGHCPLGFLLRVCDGYPVQAQYHGGMVQMVAENIYITSNYPWWEWYNMDESHPQYRALERRLTKVTHYDKPYVKIDPSNPGDYI